MKFMHGSYHSRPFRSSVSCYSMEPLRIQRTVYHDTAIWNDFNFLAIGIAYITKKFVF